MFQKIIGMMCLCSAFIVPDVRNPEFLVVLFVVGAWFILAPNIFEKGE